MIHCEELGALYGVPDQHIAGAAVGDPSQRALSCIYKVTYSQAPHLQAVLKRKPERETITRTETFKKIVMWSLELVR